MSRADGVGLRVERRAPKLPNDGGGLAIVTVALPQQPMTLMKHSSASTVPAGSSAAEVELAAGQPADQRLDRVEAACR